MKITFTDGFPPGKFRAINLFHRLYLKDKTGRRRKLMISNPELYFRLIQHERAHSQQQRELGGVGFYIWYGIEWFCKLFTEGQAYRELSFEREARACEDDTDKYIVTVIDRDGARNYLLYYSLEFGENTPMPIEWTREYYTKSPERIASIEFSPLEVKGSLIHRKKYGFLHYVFHKRQDHACDEV